MSPDFDAGQRSLDARLHTIAYRMLGSFAEAEDAVQDARLRMLELDRAEAREPPRHAEAYLVRVLSNGCIDRLRRRQREGATYPGPWLPEPLVTLAEPVAPEAQEPDARWSGGRQMSLALLHLLERLKPEERVLYVLRHGFDYRFAEISEVLGITAATARQRHRRAVAKLEATLPEAVRPSDAPGASDQQALLRALVERLALGDVDGVVSLLTEDAVALTDGGGQVTAAIVPIEGAARIAQVAMHLTSRKERAPDVRFVIVNGDPGLCIFESGQLDTVLTVLPRAQRGHRLYAVRNPEKLYPVARALRK